MSVVENTTVIEKINIPLFKRFEIHYPDWKTFSPTELKRVINVFLEMKTPSELEKLQFFEDIKKTDDHK